MKKIGLILIGTIIGFALSLVIGHALLPQNLITVLPSPYSVQETVLRIEAEAENRDWKVPHKYDLQNSMAGVSDSTMTELVVMSLCHPEHAYRLVREDERKPISALMPCRISIYSTTDGQVYLSAMNVSLISRLFGGETAKVMGVVNQEMDRLVQGALATKTAVE